MKLNTYFVALLTSFRIVEIAIIEANMYYIQFFFISTRGIFYIFYQQQNIYYGYSTSISTPIKKLATPKLTIVNPSIFNTFTHF